MALQDKIAQFSADADKLNRIVHGGPTVVVPTDGGNVRSLAKLIADGQALIDALVAGGGPGGGAANWGAIGGSLANQPDLVAALGSKQNTLPAGTVSQYLRGDKTMATLDKAAVGLPNVDNTSDAGKPISTATAAALGLKAPLASPALTGTPTAPTAAVGTNTDQIATMKAVAQAVAAVVGGGGAAVWGGIGGTIGNQVDLVAALQAKQDVLPAGTSIQYRRGDNSVANLDKSAVGLPNVDNTSDANKPVSTAQATALGLKADKTSLNAAGVGLGNVNNTSDADKPVSTAQAAAINAKAPLASPALTGTPTAPTAALGTDTDQIATMKAVKAAVAAGGGSGGFVNPMTTAGDIIVGGTSGAATRLGRGTNEYVLTMDTTAGAPRWKPAAGGAASNANSVLLDSIAGPPRTLTQKSRERVSVYDFGAVGTDRNGNNPLSNRYATLADAQAVYPFATSLADQIDWAATQLLGNFSRDQGRPVTMAGARLNINRAVILTGYYDIDGEGAAIGGQFQAAGRIFSSIAPDLTYPDATNPRVLSGCAFYIVNTPYYSKFKNMSFFDFRFNIAFYGTPNTPFFINCEFNYTQCGVIYYNGCQNPRYIGCGGILLGVLHVSSATCYPAGHPQGGDDFYFSDNLKFTNEGSFNSFGAGDYPFFDAWFIASILRPNVPSRAYQQPDQTYNDRNGQVYTDPYYLNPTGRLIFCPFRNGRDCFGLYMNGLDIRGAFKYGYMLVNTQVRDFAAEQCQYEQLVEAMVAKAPILGTVGAMVAGTLSHINQLSYIDGDHPMLGYSGRGKSDGAADNTRLQMMNPTLVQRFGELDHRGFRDGALYTADEVVPFADNQVGPQNNGNDNAPVDAALDMRGKYLKDYYLITMVENIPQQFFLPTRTPDGKVRTNLNLSSKPFVGNLEVVVWNMTRGGVPDYANYHVDTASTQTLTLQAAFNNGDTEAVFNENIDSGYDSPRFAYYRVAGQDYGFSADGAGGNRVRVMGDGNRLRGIPAGGLSAGTQIIRSQVLTPRTEFKRGWCALTSTASIDAFDGLVDYQGNGTIGVKNLTGDYTNPNACDMLTIQIRLSQFYGAPGDIYMAAPPTSGRWRVGATVKRRLDGTGPVLEWTCTAGGQPGTWRATRWETRVGTSAQRPALTAADVGVTYIDTQLSKMIVWSGSAWLV